MIELGTTLGGYRVERVLGRGGMGVVYEATQLSLGRRVALKVLRPELASDEAFGERLRREGRLQASIEHPHVIDVYEVGESRHGLFLAMRLVEGGRSLATILQAGELHAARALDLLEQAGDALDAAHAAGLIHRDVKPQNILVGEGGAAYLADFGLTRAGGDSATASRPLLGTVAYMAPEIIQGEDARPASDRYSFAATVFHCLAGEPAFPRGSDAAVMYAHASVPPPRISSRREELPAALDPIFERALSKDPRARPESAGQLVETVRTAIGAEGVAHLEPPRPGDADARTPETIESLPTRPRGTTPPRRRGLVAAVAILAMALGAGVTALVVGDESDAPEVPVPAVPSGAEPLGSDLAAPERSLDCRGQAPRAGSTTTCSIIQTSLPGAEIVAPADGKIVGWAVRGASGELALDVIRPRGEETTRVGRSQFEHAGNAAPHYFQAEIPVERGDVVGLEVGRGSSIGVRSASDATTERWFDPVGGLYGAADREAGTGFDYEVLFRADFVANGRIEPPQELRGRAAAKAPPGEVRKRIPVTISDPDVRVEAALVEVGERVALDLIDGGQRRARMFIPGLIPGGQPIDMQAYTYEGEGRSEVDVWWVNPNSGRLQFHFLVFYPRQIEFLG